MEIEKLGVKVHRDTHTFFVGAMSPGLSGYSGSSGYLGGALKVTSRPDGWQTFPQLPISDSRFPTPADYEYEDGYGVGVGESGKTD